MNLVDIGHCSPDESDIDLSDIHASNVDNDEPETLDLRQQAGPSLSQQPFEFKVEQSVCRKRPRNNPVDSSPYYHQQHDELENYRKRQKLSSMHHYYDEAYSAVEKKIRNPFLDESLMKPLDSFENYGSRAGTMNPINYTLTAEAINRRIRSTLGLEEDPQTMSFVEQRQRPPSSSDDCCTANPDWLMRRNTYGDTPFSMAVTAATSASSSMVVAASQVDIKPLPFAHDDNNNVDKKPFQ